MLFILLCFWVRVYKCRRNKYYRSLSFVGFTGSQPFTFVVWLLTHTGPSGTRADTDGTPGRVPFSSSLPAHLLAPQGLRRTRDRVCVGSRFHPQTTKVRTFLKPRIGKPLLIDWCDSEVTGVDFLFCLKCLNQVLSVTCFLVVVVFVVVWHPVL